MTLKKIFVSSELTKRAIKMNSLLEKSLNTTPLTNIRELPTLDCQLKRSIKKYVEKLEVNHEESSDS